MSKKIRFTERIVDLLGAHPEGLPILDISKLLGAHRHTITKYVYELVGADIIQIREISTAKVCSLKEPVKSKLILEKLKGRIG